MLEVTYLRHELPNNSHIRLVLLLAILHVIIEKVVIWLENRHVGNLDPTEWNARTNQVMGQALQDARARTLEPTMLFIDLRENSSQIIKCATFELTKVLSIGGGAFWKNDDWVIFVSFLALLDSFRNLLLDESLAFFGLPIQNQALRSPHNISNK